MQRPTIIFCFVLSFIFLSHSQNNRIGSLIKFDSRIDSLLFTGETITLTEKFMAIDPEVKTDQIENIETKINSFCDEFRNVNFSKNRVKQLKTLFERTHEVFLSRYREQIYFPSIFQSGEYNCVTASMLYSVILNELKLPFTLIEEPKHVYVVVYPDEDYVIFETTSPVFKEQQIPLKSRQSIVQEGIKYKIITQKEVDSIGLNAAYEQLKGDTKRVTIKDLIGFQYSNRLSYEKCESNVDRCIQNCFRSLYFNDNSELQAHVYQLVAKQFFSKKFNDLYLYKSFLMMASFIELDKEILDEMYGELLWNYYEEDRIEWILESEGYINEFVQIEPAKSYFLETLYGFYLTILETEEFSVDELMVLKEKLTILNPKSDYLEELEEISFGLTKSATELVDLFENAKFDECLDKLDSIEMNGKLNEINFIELESAMSSIVDNMIYTKEIDKAQKCMKFMFELEEDFEEFKINSYEMGYNYLFLGDYYLDKGNKAMAKKIVKEGYERFPDHDPLKDRYLHLSR